MRRLKVLITNHALAERTGSELYVLELATGLLELGHRPVAYSPVLGGLADELRGPRSRSSMTSTAWLSLPT
jgi:hypothetical protein